MMQPPDAHAKRYGSMADDDLQRLALNLQSLTPEAREGLRKEFDRRGLSVVKTNWASESPPHASAKSGGVVQRVLRNIAIFVAFDICRSLVSAHGINLVTFVVVVVEGFEGLFRPAELLLLVLLAQQFSNRGRRSVGFKLQFAAIVAISFGYLLVVDSALFKIAWMGLSTGMIYDWWANPVAQLKDQPNNKASQ